MLFSFSFLFFFLKTYSSLRKSYKDNWVSAFDRVLFCTSGLNWDLCVNILIVVQMLAQRNTKYLIKNIKQITENISQMSFDLK